MTNRPKRYQKNRKNICFALPVNYIQELQKIAGYYGVSFSDVLRYAIVLFIEGKNYENK